MAKTSKVLYKPDPQSTDEYTIIVNTEEYLKWKDGAFEVFFSAQGAQGVLGKASHQQLDTTFGTHKDVDVVAAILKDGRPQGTEGVASNAFTGSNPSRGAAGLGGAGGR
ncbi:DUF1960-domain-containing protein [Mycena belliarum]|uniref:DUF1960-domain-containing protein n=1 Tax=Mycena belliarum TaxID=1033014 RepID=A0AAD6UDC4_9AGAR|nr:DUF1960-domain-containing protein [Mycena belliae]